MPQLLSPCAATTEAQEPRAHALKQGKPRQGEVHASQLESGPCSPQPEKASEQQGRPSAARNKLFIKDLGSRRVERRGEHGLGQREQLSAELLTEDRRCAVWLDVKNKEESGR